MLIIFSICCHVVCCVQFFPIQYRELERFVAENTAAKWFCGFGLTEKTPDFSVFSKVRDRIGANKLSKIFAKLREQKLGYMSQVLSFVDSSSLIAKANLWEERDKAIKINMRGIQNAY